MATKYMLLFRGGGPVGLSPEQMQKHMEKWMVWIDSLRKKNVYLGGEPLENQGKVLSGAGGMTLTDGPFAESKEAIAGYTIIEANNETHAIELSRGCPIFQDGGRIELRPVMIKPM